MILSYSIEWYITTCFSNTGNSLCAVLFNHKAGRLVQILVIYLAITDWMILTATIDIQSLQTQQHLAGIRFQPRRRLTHNKPVMAANVLREDGNSVHAMGFQRSTVAALFAYYSRLDH